MDREPDTSFIESEQDRRGARDELSATGGEPVEPAGQDRLPVGEGVSRPFVYETPGRPEGGAGTRRREPGQVRLRRYLVTEVVTETEAGQRHEVRVQSEPVSDAEVDAD
ncbi:MAG: YsnF/AvaK domain-containing protein [Chloroflexota bacterium]|nr:YsnF/AvaK domain-containing protein [Chloroflexota bacterium]